MSDMIPAGNYIGKVTSASLENSKEKGTPYVLGECVITKGPYEGRMLQWKGWLTDATEKRTVEAIVLAGAKDMETFEGVGSVEVSFSIGVEDAEIPATDKFPKRNIQRNVVNWINKPGGSGGRPMTETDKKAVANKYKGMIAAAISGVAADGSKMSGTALVDKDGKSIF